MLHSFIKKLKNNRGDVEPAIFLVGILVVLTILIFTMDLIDLTWQRYILERELGNVSRLYATTWDESLYNPNCTAANCKYTRTSDSKPIKDIVKLVEETGKAGEFKTLVFAISTSQFSNINESQLNSCNGVSNSNTVLCIRYDGNTQTATVQKQWSIDRFALTATDEAAKPITYGTDLFILGAGTYEYEHSSRIDSSIKTIYLTNKFASERFGVYNS